MHTSKLIRVLKTFSKADWMALKLMAASPYYLRKQEAVKVQRLLELIQQAAPAFNSPQLEKRIVAVKIFGQAAPHTGTQLPKLMSRLLRLVETYLLEQQLENTGPHRQILLARAWEERGLKKLAHQSLVKAERYLNKAVPEGKVAYWQQLQLAEAWFTHYSSVSLKEATYYLQQMEIRLDEWYTLFKLEQVVWQKAQSIQAKPQPHQSLLPIDTLLKQLEKIDFHAYPVHGVYYHALLFLKDYHQVDLLTFMAVSQQLEAHGHLLEADKVKALHTLLRIFATGQYNKGIKAYRARALQLYQAHLLAGYLYFNDRIHSQTLLNMVTLGLREQEFDWVRQLLAGHAHRILDQDAAPNAFRFNQALLAFYENRLEDALHLIDDHYQNLYYRLAARRLEIMIYFEQRHPLLDAKTEAFKIYIFRLSQKQLPAKPKALNNNFVDILRQIMHPSTLGNEKRRDKIREKIVTTVVLAERAWLLERLSE